MNKFLFLFIITNIFCYNISNSQVNVGSIEYVKLKPGVFESEDLLKLKSSKTIFIYRLNDNLEELKRAINEIWTITEISFIPFSEIDKIIIHCRERCTFKNTLPFRRRRRIMSL